MSDFDTFTLEPALRAGFWVIRDTATGLSITFREHEFNDEQSKTVSAPPFSTAEEARTLLNALHALGFWACKEHRDICFMDKQDFRDQFGAHLRQRRQAKGLTIEQLSARSGVTPGNIAKTEEGRYNPRVDSLVRIADALGMRLRLVPVDD